MLNVWHVEYWESQFFLLKVFSAQCFIANLSLQWLLQEMKSILSDRIIDDFF